MDDASRDNTVALAMTMVAKYNKSSNVVRVLRLAENHGKGGAIRKVTMLYPVVKHNSAL